VSSFQYLLRPNIRSKRAQSYKSSRALKIFQKRSWNLVTDGRTDTCELKVICAINNKKKSKWRRCINYPPPHQKKNQRLEEFKYGENMKVLKHESNKCYEQSSSVWCITGFRSFINAVTLIKRTLILSLMYNSKTHVIPNGSSVTSNIPVCCSVGSADYRNLKCIEMWVSDMMCRVWGK
jgi:hypothetical protein